MTQTIATETVPLLVDTDGVIRVGNTRVTFDTVISAFFDGATAEEIAQHPVRIAQQYPSLQLADVHSAIAYYLRRRAEEDTFLQGRQDKAEKTRKENESRFDPSGIRGRLSARRTPRDV